MSLAEAWLRGIGEFSPHPSVKKNLNSPLAASLLMGNSFFFTSGFGGNSPIPPRHHQAIISLFQTKCKKVFIVKG